jgi:hypothetical protein
MRIKEKYGNVQLMIVSIQLSSKKLFYPQQKRVTQLQVNWDIYL